MTDSYFIITIDTEGDNLWDWKLGDTVQTENTMYLNRFQELCDKNDFKPIWLSNYEMLNDNRYVTFIKDVVGSGRGECGMHLHAWNTPPYYDLPHDDGSCPSYLIEYPVDIMEKKIDTLTKMIKNKVGVKPVTHRAGRWTTNNEYFKLLIKYGYKIDCSVTPGMDWSCNRGQVRDSKGSDYSTAEHYPYFINEKLLEVPVTVKNSHRLFFPQKVSLRNMARMVCHGVKGQTIWVRPNGNNLREMLSIINSRDESSDYVMFMIHSSELMPGGSPTFKTESDIEKLYGDLEVLFSEVGKKYVGITLDQYYKEHYGKNG